MLVIEREKGTRKRNELVFWQVCFGYNHLRDFLKAEHLENQKETVGIKKDLPKMMELHDV